MLSSPSRLFAAILILTGFHLTVATLTLSSLQPIAGFSDQCTQAYQTPIDACPDASSFIKPSSSPCTKDCLLALVNAGISIRQACLLQTANRGTVIGQAFVGTLAQWLCTGVNTGDGNAATTLTASNIMTSTVSTSNPASSSAPSSVSTSTSTKALSTVSSSSVAKSSASTSASTADSSTSSDTKPSSTASKSTGSASSTSHSTSSTATSKSSASPSPSSKSSSATPARASTTSIDSTPFDQTVNAAPNLGSWSGTWKQIMLYYPLASLGLILFDI